MILLLLMLFSVAGFWSIGVISTDEPRYASIGRAMAESGDWVTPRLNGEAWLEKPPLLYWLIASGYRLGLGDDTAPRLGVSLLAGLFLGLWYLLIESRWGRTTAGFGTLFLASSPFWIGYSYVAVTDAPLTITFTLAWLCAYRAIGEPARKALGWWLASGVGLGFAMLAKGLVPLVLFAPVVPLLLGRRAVREYVRAVLGLGVAMLITAGPWYVACYQANGRVFFDEFIVKHHLQRFATEALAHQRPVWFYVPYLLLAVLPWAPALSELLSAFRTVIWNDSLKRMLIGTSLFGFLFFSASINKLPGYILPLIPLLALFGALTLKTERISGWAASFPVASAVAALLLPMGWWRWRSGFSAVDVAVVALLVGGLTLVVRGQRLDRVLATCTTIVLICLGFWKVMGVADEGLSVRSFWRRAGLAGQPVCSVSPISRTNRYGLEFYAHGKIATCPEKESPFESTAYRRISEGAEGSLFMTREDSKKPD